MKRALAIDLIERALLVAYILLLLWYPVGSNENVGISLLWAAAYLLAFGGLIRERRRAAALFVGALPILAFVALLVCSTSWSDTPDIAFKRVFTLIAASAAAYLIVCRFRLVDFLYAFAVAAGAAALISLLLVKLVPSVGVMQEEYAGAWQGLFNHKNGLGEAMALGAVTMIILALSGELARRRRIVLWLAVALCGVMLVGSQSMTSVAMFVLAAGTALLFAVFHSRYAKRALPVIAAVVVSVAAVIAINPTAVFSALDRDTTLTGRTDIWSLALEGIAQRPYFGFGYETFWLPEGGTIYVPDTLGFPVFHAHDGLLELCLNVGLCGVAFFLVVLAITLWRTGRMAFTQRALCAAWPLSTMVFFLFENITEARIANYYSLINWVIFMVAALYASDPEALREPTPATRTAVARISSRTQPAPRRRHSTIPAYVAPRVADVRLGEPTIVERRWFARFRRSV